MPPDYPTYGEAKSRITDSDRREDIFKSLANEPGTTLELGEKLTYNVHEVGHEVSELSDLLVIDAVNPQERKSAYIYSLTTRGEQIYDALYLG